MSNPSQSSGSTGQRRTSKAHNPHHRSSEVGLRPIKNATVRKVEGDQFASYFDITMVRPITIEDAIKRMQRVPSVEFACSLEKKPSVESSIECDQPKSGTLRPKQVEVDEKEKYELAEERRDHFAALPVNGGPFLGQTHLAAQITANNVHSMPHCSSVLSPPEPIRPRPYHRHSTSSLTRPCIASTSHSPAQPPMRRSYAGNCSVRSSAALMSTAQQQATTSNTASLVPNTRRLTVARLPSESGDSEHYFVPRESWLTSLYVKLPKSKSFFRLQLELLNLPLFASVGRFLEETCTTTIDAKTLVEDNSFLFALFNQYVPHNRIPLETLSKHVRRLQKYEILATIEFNFLKAPSLNRRATSTCSSSSISQNTTAAAASSSSKGKKRYSRQRYAIASSTACSMKQANRRENRAKNTNQRYVPYDYNRVVLRNEQMRQTPGSDYINASHIDSLLKPNAYIVAQGPNESTVGDFWCMVWQQNVHVVVMLTKVYEFIRIQCIQYWPAMTGKPEVYDGQFEVTLVEEDKLADYVVRTMKVRCLRRKGGKEARRRVDEDEIEYHGSSCSEESEYRTIYQLHFLSWHVNSCPYSDSILKFRRRVQIYERQCLEASNDPARNGPLLVHCSNGCGRSGTYVCLDANLQLAEEEGVVDIFNYSKALRKARVSMIENLEQYRFIYETIEESYVCGKTWFNVSEISQQMKQKSQKNKQTARNEYQNEFEKLMRMTSKFTIGDCAGGHRLENRYKNRDVSIVPPDNFRPYLTSFQSKDHTDYVNAVFVDGYSRPREYIVTEWPLKSTIPDIWSLIYDHDCNTVVVLGGVPPHSSKSFPPFWPKDYTKPTKYGPVFTVEPISNNHPPNISSWVLRINKKVTSLTELMAGIKAEPKITQVFEFGAWPYDYKVPTSTNALVELIHMVERWRQRTSYGPVLVVSGNGKARVGVYCAANFAIEQVVAHQEIDIFNAVKTVRRYRSALIDTIMEYKYCYDLTLHYVSHYMNKGNHNQIFRKNC